MFLIFIISINKFSLQKNLSNMLNNEIFQFCVSKVLKNYMLFNDNLTIFD